MPQARIGLIGYSIWSLWKQKRDPLVFGILFYLITLSVVSNLVFPIGTNMAERFLFMPSIGFCLGGGFAGACNNPAVTENIY